ncbi:penicillin-binding protein [Candidatus Falkowbacteria bacterium]|jgi:1A family penicillin-binding protein|nr:penicillin-binding protein [Candidatus Falkowbacteria bacterium]
MPAPQFKVKKISSWKTESARSNFQKNSRKKPNKLNKKKIILWLLAIAAFFVLIAFIVIIWISRDLPNPHQLMEREVAQSTKIYDRSGENVLYEISGDEKRTLVSLEDIPDNVKNATIAIEDKNFYNHGAFSVWAMARTAVTNVIYRRSAGGSTLTQQFIKNAVLSNEKTISRKIKELILAYRLEKKFSKDEILQMYFNEIPYGSNAYGVESASQKYFGKSVKEITLPEAAILAALPQSPSRYSPYGSHKNLLLGRKDYILDLMAEQGYISQEERDWAKDQEIIFKERDNNITAPHFVMYIKDILSEKYGEKMIEQGGLKIYTTLDLYKQKIAEEIITERTKDYPEKYGANNASLVSLDPKTGQILVMVGSRDFFDDSIDGQVNITTSSLQPGSSMKPIVYAALFNKGYTPSTILYDVLTNFSTNPSESYTPRNYDQQERGPVSIKQALAGSLNIPAVKAIYLAGINNVLDLAENMGYTTLYPRNRFGLSLVLGGGEVKLLEHANAYSAFARDGKMSPLVSILRVEDKDGNIIEEYTPTEKKVLDSQVARMINSILSDNSARAYVFGEKNYLTLDNRPVAAKTGTTNDFRDAWTIGYTPSLVTGVWVGNSNNKAMNNKADGSVVAAPIWHDYMAKVLGDTPAETFKEPDDYTTGKEVLDGHIPEQIVNIDQNTGLPATAATPLELIKEVSVPIYHSILFYVDKDNPRGEIPKNPEKDPQFQIWEEAIKVWAEKNASSSLINLPADYNDLHNEANKPIIKIIFPRNNQTIHDINLEVYAEASAPRLVNRVEYYINNNLWETRLGETAPINGIINMLNNGYHTLTVRACDDVLNCSEASVNFNLLIKNNPITTSKNSLKLISPSSGLALNSIDFPLAISFDVKNLERVSRLALMLRDNNGNTSVIKTNYNNKAEILHFSWETIPVAGEYTLYGELHDWNGDVIKSNEIKIIIN